MLSTEDDEGWCRRWTIALVLVVAQTFVVALMASAAAFKIIEYGFFQYLMHYTNWSWTLQILFYFATLGAPFILMGIVRPDGPLGRFTIFILVIAFFPLYGVVWVVLVLVAILLGTGSPFLTNVFKQIAPSVVMLGNEFFHFVPVALLLIYFAIYHKLIFYGINHLYAYHKLQDSAPLLFIFLILEAFLGTALSLVAYAFIFNPQKVYSTDVPIVYGIIVILQVLMVVNLLFILIIVGPLRVGSRTPYPPEWPSYNEYDAESWRARNMDAGFKLV